jgi:hypothetical protein
VIGWASAHPPRSLIDLGIDLESLVVDSGEGVFQRLWTTGASEKRAVAAFCHDRGVHPDDTPFLDAEFASVQRRRAVAQSTPRADGQGFDFSNVRAAKSLALLEGLERLFALDWIDPRRLITASYASIAERALDPRELPLFSDEQHRDMTLSVRRFDPNHEMGWIRGVGLDHLDPVLVPADFVYGSAPDGIDEIRGEFWDLGRLGADNPRLAGYDLKATFKIDPEGAWPRPGQVTAIIASSVAAIRPEIMGLGPIPAIRAVLEAAGMAIEDIDAVEMNEAFAAQVVPCRDELGIDPEKLNIHGGAIALGHPFGMTGARIMTTLLNNLDATEGTLGLESMCVAGGMGQAMIVERLN